MTWQVAARRRWDKFRPGLAHELQYQSMICPWLSRVAGRYVERPGCWRAVLERKTDAMRRIILAFDPVTVAAQEAARAFAGFRQAIARGHDRTTAGKP